MKHIICFSGGHSSALTAVEVARRYGTSDVILLNHDISPKYEHADIKRFKKEVADYLSIPITHANINDIYSEEKIPSQFSVVKDAGALTDFKTQQAICTSRLKTEPFYRYLKKNFPPYDTLFEKKKECLIYYGFDKKESARITRRVGVMASMNYKTAYPLTWPDSERTIFSTEEIGIAPPSTYSMFEHANCIGCLKASLLHWYVVYCFYPEIYEEGIWMEEEIDFTVHTIIRDKVKSPISLKQLMPTFELMRSGGVPVTEHQSKQAFAILLRKYQMEECDAGKPCECIT